MCLESNHRCFHEIFDGSQYAHRYLLKEYIKHIQIKNIRKHGAARECGIFIKSLSIVNTRPDTYLLKNNIIEYSIKSIRAAACDHGIFMESLSIVNKLTEKKIIRAAAHEFLVYTLFSLEGNSKLNILCYEKKSYNFCS